MWQMILIGLRSLLPDVLSPIVAGFVTVEQSKIAETGDQARLDEDDDVHRIAADTTATDDRTRQVIADMANPFSHSVPRWLGVPLIAAIMTGVVVNPVLIWFGFRPLSQDYPQFVTTVLTMTAVYYLGSAAHAGVTARRRQLAAPANPDGRSDTSGLNDAGAGLPQRDRQR